MLWIVILPLKDNDSIMEMESEITNNNIFHIPYSVFNDFSSSFTNPHTIILGVKSVLTLHTNHTPSTWRRLVFSVLIILTYHTCFNCWPIQPYSAFCNMNVYFIISIPLSSLYILQLIHDFQFKAHLIWQVEDCYI